MDTLFDLPLVRRPGVATVPLYEVIRGGTRSAAYTDLFKRLRTDKRVHAVILDIDSPGGEVTASDSLYLSVRRLREQKPVVAFIRGVGASGSYLLACGATSIVAARSAIVGSIGVLSIRPLVPELLERLGIQFAVLKTGPFKDSGAFYRLPTDEEESRQQALIDEFYEHFLDVVAAERKMDKEAVRGVATGEVFWASRARTLGLIDELGDFETALELAARLGGVPAKSFTARPQRPLPQRLLGAAAATLVEEMSLRLDTALHRGRF